MEADTDISYASFFSPNYELKFKYSHHSSMLNGIKLVLLNKTKIKYDFLNTCKKLNIKRLHIIMTAACFLHIGIKFMHIAHPSAKFR